MSAGSKHPNDRAERVFFRCECGVNWHQVVKHYDVIRCRCQRFVWALRPKRNGPLVGYQHPGYRPGIKIEMVD